MHLPILLIALLTLPVPSALAQGFPGATVGIPLGKPDPFGSMTRPPAEPMAAPSASPAAGREATRPDQRLQAQARRPLKGHRRAEPKRRPPLAQR